MSALGALLDSLQRVTLVLGKGGVGKTTIAAGLAAHLARGGEHVVLVSTDPAGTLADAVDRPTHRRGSLDPVELAPRITLWVIDAAAHRDAFLARWRDTIATVLDRGTYLERGDIDGLVDAALPGADEVFGLLALADLLAGQREGRVVVDTAPTGHTLRLLELPRTFSALVALLDTMQEKHRFMVRALTHRYRGDEADAFITGMRARVGGLRATLTSARETGAVLVTRDEPVVLAETRRYAAALVAAEIPLVAGIVNVAGGAPSAPGIAAGTPWFALPRVDAPAGLDGCAALLDRLVDTGAPAREVSPGRTARRAVLPEPARRAIPELRPLTIVAGKGGVGKTTVACALAIVAADGGARALLVSTDPAPSIGDALRLTIGDEPVDVPDVPRLRAAQLDAAAAWARLRESYRARIDGAFEGLMARGLDAAHDRAILRDLMAMAPPGIDEVYALSVLGETLASGAYDVIVVDPAPTGHLLRLLDMPAVALDWSHRLMRLMLRYRELGSLGDTAEELLAFAKRTRALDALLRDPARRTVIEVALDEPLVRTESERLARELATRGMAVDAVVWNRATRAIEPLSAAPGALNVVAPVADVVGVAALRAWAPLWTVR